jgi:(2Fe-2S) ferredoxin
MKKYRLAVCKGPDCRAGGADQVFALCRERLLKDGLAGRCEVYRAGCFGLCHLGPNVVIREERGQPRNPLAPENFQLMGWPGEFLYSAMDESRMLRVLEQHIRREQAVQDLICVPEESEPLLK